MEQLLSSQSIVIVANNFNPSIINSHWLIQNKIISEGESKSNCLYSDGLSQTITEDFTLLVLLQQLQLTPIKNESASNVITEKLVPLISKLPQTPYSASGINFTWHISGFPGGISSLSEGLFYQPKSPLNQFFNSSDSRFGVYMSKDVEGCRLKFSALPVKRLKTGDVTISNDFAKDSEHLQVNFNFHLALNQNNALEELLRFIKSRDIYYKMAFDIINTIS